MLIFARFFVCHISQVYMYITLSIIFQSAESHMCKHSQITVNQENSGNCRPSETESENTMAVVLYKEENVLPIHKRERNFRYVGRDIIIKQDWSGLGVAAVVWDAAEVLATYLEQNADVVKDKNVIELGAGTGLVGMVAALLGARMTITDRQEVLSYLTETVKTNLPSELFQQTEILSLDWTKDSEDFTETFDVVLGADIIYIEEVFEDLLKTLIKLSDTNTVILLSCRIRYDRDTNFLTRLNEFFDVHKVMYDKPKDVKLYRVTKKLK